MLQRILQRVSLNLQDLQLIHICYLAREVIQEIIHHREELQRSQLPNIFGDLCDLIPAQVKNFEKRQVIYLLG